MADDKLTELVSIQNQLRILRLKFVSLGKQKQYLLNNFPNDYETDLFCADATEGLTGDIGTIEIPGEDQFINIQPGYESNAAYNATRDGQLWPAIAGSGSWSFFNQCILPAWQKWKPTFRFATIVQIDKGSDTCQIMIPAHYSTQQHLNVNQGDDIVLGKSNTTYSYTDRTFEGWEQFKVNNPAHPLVINSEIPEAVQSTDALVNQIWAINEEVNSKHIYATDASYRSAGDYWAIMAGDDPNALLNERGDCEDFALTKADKLISDLGLSAKNMQVTTCYTQSGDYHALLLVPTTNHGTLVLDINTIGRPTKSKLDSVGFYTWDLIFINGSQQSDYSREMFSVPIEYMNCNGAAFEIGDEVIVEFVNQDWEQSKVIGFKQNPQTCGIWFYKVLGIGVGLYGIKNSRLNMITKAEETDLTNPTPNPYRENAGCSPISAGLLFVGGHWSYDHYTDTTYLQGGAWIAKTDFPASGRSWLNTFNLNEKIYANGGRYLGSEPSFITYKQNYEFDFAADSWAQVQSLPTEINGQNGVDINGKGYVTGHGYLNWDLRICFPGGSASHWIGYGNWIGGFKGKNYEYTQSSNSWAAKNETGNPQWSQGKAATDDESFHIGGKCHIDHDEVNPNWIVCWLGGCGYGGSCVSPPQPFPDLADIQEDNASTQGITSYKPATDSWRVAGNANNFSAYDEYYKLDMIASISGRQYVVAAGYENKVYFTTRIFNGHGVIEFNPITESFDLYSNVFGPDSGFVYNASASGGIAG